MTDKYIVERVDAKQNLYKIICPNGTPPYFVNGCLQVGRELGDSQIPDNLIDTDHLSDVEKNIIKIAKAARLVSNERKRAFLDKLRALDSIV